MTGEGLLDNGKFFALLSKPSIWRVWDTRAYFGGVLDSPLEVVPGGHNEVMRERLFCFLESNFDSGHLGKVGDRTFMLHAPLSDFDRLFDLISTGCLYLDGFAEPSGVITQVYFKWFKEKLTSEQEVLAARSKSIIEQL